MTDLNFGIIAGDDNIIKISVIKSSDDTPAVLTGGSVSVKVYFPNTQVVAISKSVTPGADYFQFNLLRSDTINLPPGDYPYVAIATLADTTIHTVNNGDFKLTTGVITISKRPPST